MQAIAQTTISCFSDFRILSSAKFFTYRAYDTILKDHVVLKVFPAATSVNPKYQNEKSHLLSLNHPNVVRLLQAVDVAPPMPATPGSPTSSENSSYLVLENAAYGDLLEVIIEHGRMPEVLARTIIRDAVEALSYLHSQHIAHLDLKTENLLLDANYKLKIADFDLSQTLDSTTLEGKGTCGYRAPEIKNGTCHDFKAADIYSLGVILFNILVGHAPYNEVNSAVGMIFNNFYKIMRSNNELFWNKHSRLVGEPDFFTEEFKELINKMLSVEPSERPTIDQIKENNWYKGKVLEGEEYAQTMKEYMNQA